MPSHISRFRLRRPYLSLCAGTRRVASLSTSTPWVAADLTALYSLKASGALLSTAINGISVELAVDFCAEIRGCRFPGSFLARRLHLRGESRQAGKGLPCLPYGRFPWKFRAMCLSCSLPRRYVLVLRFGRREPAGTGSPRTGKHPFCSPPPLAQPSGPAGAVPTRATSREI